MRVACLIVLACSSTALAQTPNADEIVQKMLDADAWGFQGAESKARLVVKDAGGAARELVFVTRSRKIGPGLSKSLLRFQAPAELVGVGFLQIQKPDKDDDRYLYLPDLKKSRRIAGKLRSNAFMGTDFTYADLDGRDLRESRSVIKGEESLGKFPCWRVDSTPKDPESAYAKVELWIRKDNFVPLKSIMYGKDGAAMKTLLAQEVQRKSGRWFITRSLMQNAEPKRTTELTLVEVTPRDDIPDDEMTVRNLEKE